MSVIPDESQRYNIAFTGLAHAGLTKEKLLSTAKHYLSVIEGEIKEFDESYNQTYEQLVGKVERDIQIKQQQAEEMMRKATNMMSEIEGMKHGVSKNITDLSDKKNKFMQAGNAQKQEIEEEIGKITQYIK